MPEKPEASGYANGEKDPAYLKALFQFYELYSFKIIFYKGINIEPPEISLTSEEVAIRGKDIAKRVAEGTYQEPLRPKAIEIDNTRIRN